MEQKDSRGKHETDSSDGISYGSFEAGLGRGTSISHIKSSITAEGKVSRTERFRFLHARLQITNTALTTRCQL